MDGKRRCQNWNSNTFNLTSIIIILYCPLIFNTKELKSTYQCWRKARILQSREDNWIYAFLLSDVFSGTDVLKRDTVSRSFRSAHNWKKYSTECQEHWNWDDVLSLNSFVFFFCLCLTFPFYRLISSKETGGKLVRCYFLKETISSGRMVTK